MKKDRFKLWLDARGAHQVAALLCVDVMTVNHWRAKRCYPRVHHMVAIRELSRGRVTYADIIDRGLADSAKRAYKRAVTRG